MNGFMLEGKDCHIHILPRKLAWLHMVTQKWMVGRRAFPFEMVPFQGTC